MDVLKGVSADRFYGPRSAAQKQIESILNKSSKPRTPKCIPGFMNQLLGPSRTWKVFDKQSEAINFCLQKRNELMCFAFEQPGGRRSFLVAHPKVFWALNYHRFFRDCSTYEIIREFGVCKLYFDIEYEYEFNSEGHIGDRMLNNFLHIVNSNLQEHYGINCTLDHILDLDSSSAKKYSHHVIYQIPNTGFSDSYAVGNFVKMICYELTSAYNSDVDCTGCKNELNYISHKYSIKLEEIFELFVYDNKGKVKLFIDQGVYTKNRHFRLLGSTKLNKNSPLIVSQNNKYKPQSKEDPNLSMFLDSLITYFSTDVIKILECDGSGRYHEKTYKKSKKNFTTASEAPCPMYPVIDKFIHGVISPFGSIRRKSFFSSTSKIVYDICGYRYCDNIKRHHKSNNIMFVINLQDLTFYQKCHDPDCAGFKSGVTKLPEEICFHLEDDSQFMHCVDNDLEPPLDESIRENDISETEFNEILSSLDYLANDSNFLLE